MTLVRNSGWVAGAEYVYHLRFRDVGRLVRAWEARVSEAETQIKNIVARYNASTVAGRRAEIAREVRRDVIDQLMPVIEKHIERAINRPVHVPPTVEQALEAIGATAEHAPGVEDSDE